MKVKKWQIQISESTSQYHIISQKGCVCKSWSQGILVSRPQFYVWTSERMTQISSNWLTKCWKCFAIGIKFLLLASLSRPSLRNFEALWLFSPSFQRKEGGYNWTWIIFYALYISINEVLFSVKKQYFMMDIYAFFFLCFIMYIIG